MKKQKKTNVQIAADKYYKMLDKVLALKTVSTGSWFLLNLDKHKSGKNKGKHKYIKFVGLDWNKTDAKTSNNGNTK